MAYKRTSAGRTGKGMESPAAMRKGHSAMGGGAVARTQAGNTGRGLESPAAMRKGNSTMHGGRGSVDGNSSSMAAPQKGYGNEGSMTKGARKVRK